MDTMGKRCVIGGASGGVATALAARLRAQGWQLALVGRDASRLAAQDGDLAIEADLASPEAARAAFAQATQHWGAAPDGFVNAAGNTLIAPLARTTEAQYRECLRANLDTSFFGLQAWVAALQAAKRPGAAVLFSSVVAGIGVANHAAVAAAKGAVEALARSIAADMSAQGIRINVVAPGLMRTPMTQRMVGNESMQRQIAAQYPLGRHGEADDGAALAAWLLSDEAGWITGQTIGLDGGFSAVRPMVRAAP